MIKYVKSDAMIVSTLPAKKEPVLDSAMKSKILALEEINEFTVRKAGARTRALARVWLKQMHNDGELKTLSERVSELAPKEDDLIVKKG